MPTGYRFRTAAPSPLRTACRAGLAALCTAGILVLASPPAAAQQGAAEIERSLRADLQRARAGGVHAVNSTVFAWLSARPDAARGILDTAFEVAPEYRQQVAAAVAQSFPAYRAMLGAPGAAPPPAATAIPAQMPGAAQPAAQAPAPSPVPAAAPPAQSPWEGEISVGGSRLGGNTESTALSAAGELTYEARPWEFESALSYDYASEESSTTAQRLAADLVGRRDIGGRWYAFGDLSYVDDRFSGFAWEASEAVGAGYRFVDTEELQVRLEAGPGLRQSKREDTGDIENETVLFTAADAEWKFSEHAELSNRLEVELGQDRTRTSNRTALTTQMIGDIATRLSFEVRHDSDPPPDSKATDTIAKVNLVYCF